MLSPGTSFDRYTIEALLGEGGMGRVYRAFDARLRRRVALKVLRGRRIEGARGSERPPDGATHLLREAQAAAALEHPNAVAIFDVGEVDGTAFIAMELIAGRSLRAFVGDANVAIDVRVAWLV